MNKLIDFVKNNIIRRNNITSLGRWGLEYNSKKINRKIDWSNEDHCGPCGQLAINKLEKINKLAKNNVLNK